MIRVRGRYAVGRKPGELVPLFDVEHREPGEALGPDGNAVPTKPVRTVLERPVDGCFACAGGAKQSHPAPLLTAR